jgi:hypothetical protein
MAKKEAGKKKLQAKDLGGRKIAKDQAVDIKGGKPKIICLSVRSMG